MGKDREGKYHPRKGKPSGSLNEGLGVQSINTSTFEEQLEIAEKYTEGEERPAPNIHVRHPNRNVDKREERQTRRNNAQKPANENGSEARVESVAEELPGMLTKEQFSELANYRGEPCITFYMESSSAGQETGRQQDKVLVKNKLQQAAMLLKDKAMDSGKIDRMLKPGYDLLQDDGRWTDVYQGLAFFIADGYFRYIKLPIKPKDELLVNTTFLLTPLIPVMTTTEHFFVLVISKKQAKLYRADAFGMRFIPVNGMPRGVEDVVHFEQKDDDDLFRTETIGAGSGASYHGIGTGRPEPKTNLAMYFDEVDETLWKEILHDEHAPLLLAGVEYLIPIYKQVAKYKPIWEDSITGNHEHEDTQSLYRQAREKMAPYFKERVAKALNAYGNQSATTLTTTLPEDIIPAAHYGRVSQLFALKGEHIWGRFDESDNQLSMHGSQEADDECLVDRAVIRTLLNGGDVFILPAEEMPGGSKLAAIMRY